MARVLANAATPLPGLGATLRHGRLRRGDEPPAGPAVPVADRRPLALPRPCIFSDSGHYRGRPGVEDQIVYVALLPNGSQRTYTPAEFAKTFGWKNDPEKAELLGK